MNLNNYKTTLSFTQLILNLQMYFLSLKISFLTEKLILPLLIPLVSLRTVHSSMVPKD